MEEVHMDVADPMREQKRGYPTFVSEEMREQKKGCPTVVSEEVESPTTRVLHVSCMFWGCCSDALIINFDEAAHEVMDCRYSTFAFEVSDIDGDKIMDHGALYNLSFIVETGFYFLSDGGYPNVKYLICPFKWPEVGTDRQKWST
jgi:hypothetical protein